MDNWFEPTKSVTAWEKRKRNDWHKMEMNTDILWDRKTFRGKKLNVCKKHLLEESTNCCNNCSFMKEQSLLIKEITGKKKKGEMDAVTFN